MWGKLSQYCLYRWNLLLRGVQHDRRAIPCLALPCSSSTWTSDDASAPVTSVRYMLLGMLSFVLYAYDYALCAPFVFAVPIVLLIIGTHLLFMSFTIDFPLLIYLLFVSLIVLLVILTHTCFALCTKTVFLAS